MFNYANRAKGFIFWNTIGRPFRWIRKLVFRIFLITLIGSGICAVTEAFVPAAEELRNNVSSKIQGIYKDTISEIIPDDVVSLLTGDNDE